MADFISAKGECQAIVRFVRAIVKQVGLPGLMQIIVVFSDPDVNNGNTVLEQDTEAGLPAGTSYGYGLNNKPSKTIRGAISHAGLVDKHPGDKPGQTFDQNSAGRFPYIGMNMFEACLKFTYPEPSGGAAPAPNTSKYYPGGTEGGIGVDTKEIVIKSFYALVWFSIPPEKPGETLRKIEQIVKRYRDDTIELP